MTDIDAIRARDAASIYPSPEHPWSVMLTDAQEDRRALLALLDAERAEAERLDDATGGKQDPAAKWSDVPVGAVHDPGCHCWPHVSLDHYEAIALAEYRQGKRDVATERARIAEAVRGLPEASADGMWEWFGHNAPPTIVDRAAVLAAIEGVTT